MNIHENQRKSTNIHKNYTKTDKNYRLHPWDPNAPRNVHPCAYDAYGMTVVEAAACGAPSLLATGAEAPCAATGGYGNGGDATGGQWAGGDFAEMGIYQLYEFI